MENRKHEIIKKAYNIENKYIERRKLIIQLEKEHQDMLKDEMLTVYERYYTGFMSILANNIKNKYPNLDIEYFNMILENILISENIINNFVDRIMDNIKDEKDQNILIKNSPIYLLHNKDDIGDYYLYFDIENIDDLSSYDVFIGSLKR